MKVTTFKDLGVYLYTSIALPLRQLNVPVLEFGSPMRGDKDEEWTILLDKAPVRHYRRSGQRHRAHQNSDWLIKLHVSDDGDGRTYTLARYNVKNHNVTMYSHPFKVLNAIPLYGKMHDMFKRCEPFNEIIEGTFPPRQPYFRDRNRDFVPTEEAIDAEDLIGYAEGEI